ncbi:hypothetical protein ACTHGU_08590 [Chitinophagaceae bacterium MMS25-I14]
MQQVPFLLKAAFVLIALVSLLIFYKAANKSKTVLAVISIWMVIQAFIGSTDFYADTSAKPPRLLFMLLPPVLLIVILFFNKRGKTFIDSLDIKWLTLLHSIRIFVELSLYYLFLAKTIPEIMTFAGRNFDILAGLTALVVYYLAFVKKHLSRNVLIAWNLLSLGLLFNIIIIAVLSAPTPFQQFGMEQPNIAISFFPFNWLPSVVVPLVLFAHLASLRLLLAKSDVYKLRPA